LVEVIAAHVQARCLHMNGNHAEDRCDPHHMETTTMTNFRTTTAVRVARRNKVNPKIARRRLRDAGYVRPAAGWVFFATQHREIARVVRG